MILDRQAASLNTHKCACHHFAGGGVKTGLQNVTYCYSKRALTFIAFIAIIGRLCHIDFCHLLASHIYGIWIGGSWPITNRLTRISVYAQHNIFPPPKKISLTRYSFANGIAKFAEQKFIAKEENEKEEAENENRENSSQ